MFSYTAVLLTLNNIFVRYYRPFMNSTIASIKEEVLVSSFGGYSSSQLCLKVIRSIFYEAHVYVSQNPDPRAR